MNEVPLVKDNKINDINTSLIAIKKQLKQLIEVVGLSGSPDMSPYVKKADVTDVVEVGNTNPVTSNGVAVALEEMGGLPLGTLIAVYSNVVPAGYLPCNGVEFDINQYPALYLYLNDNHTPDLRECTLKMIGESGRTVGAHVKTGGLSVGEFIDDRIQNIKITRNGSDYDLNGATAIGESSGSIALGNGNWGTLSTRHGATTEVKAVGVNICIKARSGLDETQQDYVLNSLVQMLPRYPDYARGNIYTGGATSYTATQDCYINLLVLNTTLIELYINSRDVGAYSTDSQGVVASSFSGYLKQGDIVSWSSSSNMSSFNLKVFTLR